MPVHDHIGNDPERLQLEQRELASRAASRPGVAELLALQDRHQKFLEQARLVALALRPVKIFSTGNSSV